LLLVYFCTPNLDMPSLVRNIKHIFLLLIAMQILNTGLFAQDFQALKKTSTPVDETNIIHSVTDYIGEVIFLKTNTSKEKDQHRNHHHKHHLPVKTQSIKLISRDFFIQQTQAFVVANTTFESVQKPYLNFIREITPPPPKA